jgi:hypothetical protein
VRRQATRGWGSEVADTVGVLMLACVAASLALPFHGEARALPPPRGELELVPGQIEDFLRGPVVILSPHFTFSTALTQETFASVGLGFTVAAAGSAPDELDGAAVVLGNPSVSVVQRLGQGLAAKVLVTVPLATRSAWGDGLGELAESAARGLRGHVDPWLWLADHFAAVGTVMWAIPGEFWLIELQPSVALMLPTRRLVVDAATLDSGADAPTDRGQGFAVQLRGRAGIRLWDGLWFLAGLNWVWTPTVERDADQASIVPELRWSFEDGGHVALAAVLNIDGPWGPTFGDGWVGLRLSGSWRF